MEAPIEPRSSPARRRAAALVDVLLVGVFVASLYAIGPALYADVVVEQDTVRLRASIEEVVRRCRHAETPSLVETVRRDWLSVRARLRGDHLIECTSLPLDVTTEQP